MARPDCWGCGSSGYAERCRADTRSKRPSVTPPAPPRVPFPGRRSFSPRLTARRSVRAASRVTASSPSPRTLRPGPEQLLAKRGGTTSKGREGGGGERAAPRPYKERPGEGAGRARGGRTRQETPPGRGPGPARGSRLCKGPPAASLLTTAPAGHRPPFPQHRPLMSFPDLPPPPSPLPTRECWRTDSPSALRAELAGEYPRGLEAAQSRFPGPACHRLTPPLPAASAQRPACPVVSPGTQDRDGTLLLGGRGW